MAKEAASPPPRKDPVFTGVEAQLFVTDIAASCAFYTEPPSYGQVVRDTARLNLRVIGEPVFVGSVREREQLLSASVTVATSDEIERLFSAYQARGVRFNQALKTEPWGARTFVVQDPDGNLLLFAGPAD